MNKTARILLATTLAAATLIVVQPAATAAGRAAAGVVESAGTAVAADRLTNLAHLDFLTDRVALTPSAAHTTYRLAEDPEVGVIWVYADARDGGTFERVGGGGRQPDGTWGQGAYDTDDITRAAIAYLREWQATGSMHAKEQAYQQLRGAAYFQTLTGPKAGEVVLWMQEDGTLTPSPTPTESPNPADSDESYWLARTIWAYGEGYAAFQRTDPAFAAFLAQRMQLSLTALNRDTLDQYGQYQVIHGKRVPDWLIVDGADASSEAMLGLAAYVRAGGPGSAAAASALKKLAKGVAEMSAGSTTQWPYRALLPWALSRSDWHAWGAQMGSGLAAASRALQRPNLLKPAVGDAAGFTPQLLTSTGPINGLLPGPNDGTQIAYGADARVQTLLSVGKQAHSDGIRDLAGVAAGWYFGANPAGVAVYDPATGVTNDGVQADGTVNRNSGAESTIHGLLSMQVLDAHPDLRQLAERSADVSVRNGLTVVEAETASVTGAATVVTPDPAWTGESLWSGKAVEIGRGGLASWTLPASDEPRLVQPVVELVQGSRARATVQAGRSMGIVRFGAVGAQGNAPAEGMLIPADLGVIAPERATVVTARGAGSGTGRIDSLHLMPLVATLAATGDGHATTLLTSKSGRAQDRTIELAGSGRLTAASYDRFGRSVGSRSTFGDRLTVSVPPGGFVLATR